MKSKTSEQSPPDARIAAPTPPSDDVDTESTVLSLWDEAYKKFCEENKSLVHDFEEYLLESQNPSSDRIIISRGPERQGEIEKLAKDKLDALETNRLHFSVWGKEIVVRDQLKKVLKFILTCKDVISAAISAEPGASIAWSGALVILQVSTARVCKFHIP